MTQVNEINIFLASSSELELERVHIGDFFNDINSILFDTDVRVRLLKWEVFDPKFTGERKQSEYCEQIKKSDIFFVLFRTKAGKFTLEEVEVAKQSCFDNQTPKELYCLTHEYQGKREFEIDELKEKIGDNFKYSFYNDISDLKFKIINLLKSHLTKRGVNLNETNKFIQINSTNILRKNMDKV